MEEERETKLMALLKTKGYPTAPIWVIVERPFRNDEQRGWLFSSGLGYVFDRMREEAGLRDSDFFFTARRPDLQSPSSILNVLGDLETYKPPFILVMGDAAPFFLPALRASHTSKNGDSDDTDDDSPSYELEGMEKWVGSLLTSPSLSYPHFIMPFHSPERVVGDWTERNVSTHVDLGKIREELAYYRRTGTLQALPNRTLLFHDFELGELLSLFDSFRGSDLLSVDIETVYPREKSVLKPHPGYPITIGIAPSPSLGISFNLFRELPSESRILWRALDSLLAGKRILGQNFFNFDTLFFRALGFGVEPRVVEDTILRHHILWPELPHSLAFLTRQYTREPFYKDDGKRWSLKDMGGLRRYNCLDVCVTYEVYNAQEEEFKERPALRGRNAA
jgi:hypothetical protein